MTCRKSSVVFTITAAVAFVCTVITPHTKAAQQQKKIYEGSWTVSITGGSGVPPLPDWYQALATFTREGGLIATVTDPTIQTGHGSWSKIGNREFAITTLLFQFDTTGHFLGTLKARATLKVNKKGDEFTSDRFLFEFFDRDGNLQTSGEGTAHGVRIKVEPL